VWQIRGAPAIASLAALSVSQHLARALRADPAPEFFSSSASLAAHVSSILDFLFTARPTAVNLGAATRRLSRTLQASLDAGKDARAIAEDLIDDSTQVAAEDVGRNKAMAKWGGEWLVQNVKGKGGSGDGLNVLTVCNTGSLATSVIKISSFLIRFVANVIPRGRDMVRPLDLSPTSTKRGSSGEHIIRRQLHITRAPGA
jgi:methylthioribose-1-phosphate isomerase